MRGSSPSWRIAVPALAGVLLTLAGCSSDGSRPASADGPATTAATAPTSAPTPTPTPTAAATTAPAPTTARSPVADCIDTSAFTTTQMHDYLTALPGASSGLKGLRTDEYGVYFDPAVDHRSCRTLYVNVSHYWVLVTTDTSDTTGTTGTTRRTPGTGRVTDTHYVYVYAPISTTAVALTLGVGNVPGTAPPEPAACKGTLTVVHLGEAITDAELPATLSFESSPTGYGKGTSEVTVKADRALSAVLVSPTSRTGC
ncbi:hypothetical protein [Kitasatospora sp. NBC_00315]|uniref:hypothetical protein n=1 Tax=Kitasatospora sp. NBC_00315 TaxID=2975963 RepID=UPI00324D88E2